MPCIGFDFDGTIADTKVILSRLYNEILSKQYGGRRMSAEDIEHLKNLSFIEKIRFLRISPFRLPFFVRAARQQIGENIEQIPLFPGILELLVALKEKGFQIAILSSNKTENIQRFLRNKAIRAVDHVYCDKGYSLFVKSQTIRQFLKRHAISREEFIYVGDEVRDIEACRRENIRIITVTWGWDPAEILAKASPDYCVERPQEIFTIAEKLFPEAFSRQGERRVS